MLHSLLHKISPFLFALPPLDGAAPAAEPAAAEPAAAADMPPPAAPAPTPSAASAPAPAPVVASPAEPAAPKPEPKPAKEDPAKFLDNPIVRAEIAKQAKLAAKQAREEAAAEAAQAAERAQMAESDRLRAEKADAEKAKLEAKTAADNAIRRAGIYKAVLDGKYALQDGGSDYLEYSVGNLLQANPDMDISEAVAQTVQSSPFMLIPETPVAPVAAQETPALAASPVPKPTTAPVEHHAQSKTKEKPVDGVDTLNMTAAEYRLYKAKTYGG